MFCLLSVVIEGVRSFLFPMHTCLATFVGTWDFFFLLQLLDLV